MKKYIVSLLVFLFVMFFTTTTKAETPYEWHTKETIIEAPFEQTVAAVTNYGDYAKILPYVDEVRVISARGPEGICYFQRFEPQLQTVFWVQIRFKVAHSDPDKFILHTNVLKTNAYPFESEIIVEKLSDKKVKVTSKLIVFHPEDGQAPEIVKWIPDGIINHYVNNFLDQSLKKLNKYLVPIKK